MPDKLKTIRTKISKASLSLGEITELLVLLKELLPLLKDLLKKETEKPIDPGNPVTPVVPRMECWFEAFFHSWFIGSDPNKPQSDHAGMLSVPWTQIHQGKIPLPPEAAIRFSCGVVPQGGGPADKSQGFPVQHCFELEGLATYRLPSTSFPGVQPIPGFGRLQHGPDARPENNLFARFKGWDGIIRMNGIGPEPRKLSYWIEDPQGNQISNIVTIPWVSKG